MSDYVAVKVSRYRWSVIGKRSLRSVNTRPLTKTELKEVLRLLENSIEYPKYW